MKLSTAEQFVLLAHHPEKGRFIVSDIQFKYGIIGAILLDMSLDNSVILENDRLLAGKNIRSENEIVSDIAAIINSSGKPRKMRYWISRLATKSGKYKWAILNGLVARKLVRIENRKFLGLIPYRKSFLTESRQRFELIQHLKNSILFRKELSRETIVVLGLVEACKMHRIITKDRDELKTMRKELKRIIKESPIADTVDKTIKEVQAAIIGAIIASSVAASAASSN